MRRWLALSVLALGLTVGLSKASGTPVTTGLSVVGYSINQIPPVISDTVYPTCGSGWFDTINQSFDQQPFADCGWDRFMLHYKGFVTLPEGTQSVRWAVAADDGGVMQIGNTTFGSWRDKGCTVMYSQRVIADTTSTLDGWFYENGGGTCFRLYWQLNGDNQNWVIVPWTAFTSEVPPTTTLQETTTTTELPTTSTVPPTTVTDDPTTTSVPVEPAVVQTTTTTVAPLSTATTSSSTSPYSTTIPPQTTTVKPPTTAETTTVPPPPVTTIQSTTSSAPLTTTTTVVTISPDVKEIPPAEAVALATNAEVLKTVTTEEAAVIFQSIDETQLTDDQGLAIVNAVQNAPTSVRKAFEKGINIFGGHTDTYVPVGSVIPVKARRVIIVTGLLLAVPAVTPRRRK